MAEYIEREAVLRDWPLCDEPADAYQFIRGFPAADVVVRKTGVWIGEGDGYADGVMVYDTWFCGCCGTQIEGWEEKPKWKYCPVCGSYNGGNEDV